MSERIKNIKEAFSWTTSVAGTTWDPTVGRTPFNITTGMGMNDSLSKGHNPTGELGPKADKIFPFPLDRIIEQLVVSYESLIKTKSTLIASLKSPTMNKQEKDLLRKQIKYVDKSIQYIKTISKEIESIQIGYT
jgi:hypothetical protein